GVTAALAARDATRNSDDSHTLGTGRPVQVARECTYPDFLKCQPLNFKGTEGVVGLSRCHPSNAMEDTGKDNDRQILPRGEIKKLESEIWNLKVKGTDVVAYSQCFQELALINPPNVNTGANQRGNVSFECGAQGYFKKECPKLKNNNNRGNQVGNDKARAKVYAVGKVGANPDNNVITGLSSFDVIIGMDWLAKYHAVIICAEKIVRIPFGDEILIVRGDGSSNKHGARLNIISYTKTQEYLTKGCHVFLANITATKDEDKSKGKRLEDLPVVQEFPEDLLDLELLKKEELYAKFSKCEFWIFRVQFLGHVIDYRGIHIDPAKIESIKDWPSPKTPIEIRQFLGLAGYYRRLIEGFSKIAKSMTRLTQKDIKFDWGNKQEATFQQIKQKLCSVPILALPEGSKDFMVYCDASIQGKANVVADALSRNERVPLRVQALVKTIGLDLPKQILKAQTEAQKPENIKNEDVGGMLIENAKNP
nr:putative reverse transcriptase domain-containing protein [Tanacetum cinerariifolium]